MYMSSLFRSLLLLFFCLGASSSFAESTYYYRAEPTVFYSTLDSACAALFARANYTAPPTMAIIHVTASYPGSACFFRYSITGQSGTSVSGFYVDGVVGKTPIVDGKVCSAGTPGLVTWPLGLYDSTATYNIMAGTQVSPPAEYCVEGCVSSLASSSGSCYQNDDPPVNSVTVTYCDYNFIGTTDACATSSNPEPPEPTPPADPCVTDPASCEPPPDPDPCEVDPASCVPGGGGDDGGGGDTGGGTDTQVDPTPGAGTEPAEPAESSGGAGTGDHSASGMACNQPVACAGDAIQCAILAQEKAQRCLDVENSNYPAQKDAIKSLVDGPEFELEQSEIAAPSLLDQHARFLSGATCPPPETFHMTHGGGHNLQFSYEPMCRLASDLSWIIVAFATLAAALYVGRSFGGG